MFLEKNNKTIKKGWIEVVCGSMFSGKTEELIRRMNRAKIAKQKIENLERIIKGVNFVKEKELLNKQIITNKN